MKKLSFILLFIVNGSFAQLMNSSVTKTEDLQKSVDLLLQNLQSNPDNPLQIDNAFLTNLTQQITDPSLKNLMQSYSTSLGTDSDLSYRQIYWDLSQTLNSHSALASNSQYAVLGQELNLMFDNYNVLTEKLKSNGANYEFGSFINDPNLISSLSNLTGSYESAQAAALGLDLLTGFINAYEETQKFKEDYKKMAKISTDMIFTEKDPNISKALIDASIGIEQHQMITPLYRYDFKNGATLRVENGILKYIDAKKGIVKDLTIVEKRHDGNYYNRDTKALDAGAHTFPTAIAISPDDSLFYLYTGANTFQENKSSSCLDKKTGCLISAYTGDVISSRSDVRVPQIDKVRILYFNKGIMLVPQFKAKISYNEKWLSDDGNLTPNYKDEPFALDENKGFLVNNQFVKFSKGISYSKNRCVYSFNNNNLQINLFWAKCVEESGMVGNTALNYNSSLLQIAGLYNSKTKFFNADAMVNELTGIAMDKSGNFYFIGKEGKIGRLGKDEYKLDDQALQSKMREKMSNKIAAPFDFNAEKKYLSNHGELANSSSSIYPTLIFTPDEKWLIYVVNDNLYIINPNNFNDFKEYKLSFEPNNCFFGKENGDYTLFLQGQNDFKFPITKKYSIGKLSTMVITKPSLVKTTKTTTTNANSSPSNTNSSLADEIKKLKELFDAGAITQEEFTAAKAKLLNTSSNSSTTTTNNSNNTTTNSTSSAAKSNKKVHTFDINGKSYCAVNASESGLDIYGLYKYLGKEIRTYDSKEGEPIVQLDKTDKPNKNDDCVGKSGLWQAHGERAKAITWWLSSDCNGNVEVITTENFRRYNIVVRYEEEDEPGHSNYPKGSYDFMSLSIYTDGSNKVLILGERVKQ